MRKKVLALTVASAVTASSLVVVPTSGAAELEGAIDAFRISGTAIPGNFLRVDMTWSVPDDAVAGDTFRVSLPPEMRPIETTFPLLNAEGEVVANAVASNEEVVFTLTDFVDNHNSVNGFAYFTLAVDREADPGPVEIIWDEVGAQASVVNIVDEGDVIATDPWRQSAGKWGENLAGTNKVVWTVQGPIGTPVAIVDQAPAGQTIVCEESFPHLMIVDQNGAWQSDIKDLGPDVASMECSEGHISVTITNVEAGQVPALRLVTEVTPDAYVDHDEQGNPVVRNDAQVAIGEEETETYALSTIWAAGGGGEGVIPTPSSTPSTTPSESSSTSVTTSATSSTPTSSTEPAPSSSTTVTPTSSTPTASESVPVVPTSSTSTVVITTPEETTTPVVTETTTPVSTTIVTPSEVTSTEETSTTESEAQPFDVPESTVSSSSAEPVPSEETSTSEVPVPAASSGSSVTREEIGGILVITGLLAAAVAAAQGSSSSSVPGMPVGNRPTTPAADRSPGAVQRPSSQPTAQQGSKSAPAQGNSGAVARSTTQAAAPAQSNNSGTSRLANTGASVIGIVLVGILLALAGLFLVRRKES